MVEEKFLFRNFKFNDSSFFNIEGDETTPLLIAANISSVFTIPIDIAKLKLNDWLLKQGYPENKIVSLYPNYELVFTRHNEPHYFLGVDKLRVSEHEPITTNIGHNLKITVAQRGPTISFRIKYGPLYKKISSKLYHDCFNSSQNKYDISVRPSNTKIERMFLGCYISSIAQGMEDQLDDEHSFFDVEVVTDYSRICSY